MTVYKQKHKHSDTLLVENKNPKFFNIVAITLFYWFVYL